MREYARCNEIVGDVTGDMDQMALCKKEVRSLPES